MTPKAIALLAVLCAASISPCVASAQQPGPGEPFKAQMQARHEARERQRLQDLHTVLHLRPDQDAALSAFLQSAEPGPPPGPRDRPPQPMTTPDRADAMARRRAERTQARLEGLKSFYAALSPDQRTVFDALMRLRASHGNPGPHDGKPGPERGRG